MYDTSVYGRNDLHGSALLYRSQYVMFPSGGICMTKAIAHMFAGRDLYDTDFAQYRISADVGSTR